jgi:hypothetical protein
MVRARRSLAAPHADFATCGRVRFWGIVGGDLPVAAETSARRGESALDRRPVAAETSARRGEPANWPTLLTVAAETAARPGRARSIGGLAGVLGVAETRARGEAGLQ